MLPQMRCRSHFPHGLVKTYLYWRNNICKFLCGPNYFLLVQWLNSYLFIVLAPIWFSKLIIDYLRAADEEFLRGPRIQYVLPIHWHPFECSWEYLECVSRDLEEPPIYIISPIRFFLNRGEMANTIGHHSSENHLTKIFNSISWPSLFLRNWAGRARLERRNYF